MTRSPIELSWTAKNDDNEKIDDIHKIDHGDPTCFSNVIAMTVARTARAPTRSVASGTWSNITTWIRGWGKIKCQAWSLVHLVKENSDNLDCVGKDDLKASHNGHSCRGLQLYGPDQAVLVMGERKDEKRWQER